MRYRFFSKSSFTVREEASSSGAISRMQRHAVHMQADPEKAWKSARRWKGEQRVVLKIAAAELSKAGASFGKSENDVWCCEEIPAAFICEVLK